MDNGFSLDTLCIHAGQEPDPTSGAVMTPIVLASTFAQDGPGVHKGYDYSRAGNPTRSALEGCLAALEGAKHGVAFGSGCAASTAVLLMLKSGDHVLSGDDIYGGTFRIFDSVMKPFGLDASFIDMTDPARVRAAIRPTTRLLWLETPSNPMLKIFDIAKIAEIAHAAKIPLLVDNTFATPMLQRPLDLGADMVLHSATKYLNGHSDVVAGAVMTRSACTSCRRRSAACRARSTATWFSGGSRRWACGCGSMSRAPRAWPSGSSGTSRSRGFTIRAFPVTRATRSRGARWTDRAA